MQYLWIIWLRLCRAGCVCGQLLKSSNLLTFLSSHFLSLPLSTYIPKHPGYIPTRANLLIKNEVFPLWTNSIFFETVNLSQAVILPSLELGPKVRIEDQEIGIPWKLSI